MSSHSSSQVEAIVLAAGQGTRMRSRLAKVLHPLAGQPLLHHVLERALALGARRTHVVVGHQAERVREATDYDVQWVVQTEQLGTGHAVQQAMPGVGDGATVLILYGDVPLVPITLLSDCVTAAAAGGVGLITADFDDPAALGRILRDEAGAITGIIEFKDADAAQRNIKEINSGIMALQRDLLTDLLARINADNAQNEYYLTDIIALAAHRKLPITGIKAARAEDVMGINDRVQLAELERYFQRQQAEALMRAGVTIADPTRLDIRGVVSAGQDVSIDINVVLEGDVTLADGVQIGPGVVIRNSKLAEGVRIEAHTVVEGADIGPHSRVGPFARIRPGTRLGKDVHIGNFVEIKKSTLGDHTKAGHLAYLGDASIGIDCNIGAGTVTCNYDGIHKHPTDIGDHVFVGTNSTLVAPVGIGDNAFVAAGSTITRNIDDDDLGIGRGKQRNIKGWTRPDKRQ